VTRLRLFLAAAFALLSMSALPASLGAQGTINLDLPSADPCPAAPDIHVSAVGLPPANGPYSLRLRLALGPDFGLIAYDSTMAGTNVNFRTIKLLPENQNLFAEASVIDASGRTVLTTLRFAGKTGLRLALVSPNGSINITLATRHPQFSWRSAQVTGPPGPWVYELHVIEVATQQTIVHQGITDTVYVLPDTLQAQTSYRWSVIARLANGLASDGAVASSASSFVVFPSDQAAISLLYQNFPNPFPAAASASTCIWFDLEKDSKVRLSVLDLRGRKVKTIIPGQVDESLSAGRYGRLGEGSSGCNELFTWDGTADDGRTVPPGVYLLHLVVDGGAPMVKKMLFLGH
jgi:hypothetical protein